MSEMVERVARAIAVASASELPLDASEDHWPHYIKQAQAAIAAASEPGEFGADILRGLKETRADLEKIAFAIRLFVPSDRCQEVMNMLAVARAWIDDARRIIATAPDNQPQS